jgi:hypothetical protein
VQPVGLCFGFRPAHGFSKLFESSYPVLRCVVPRPLPKSNYVNSSFGFGQKQFFPAKMQLSSFLYWISKLTRPTGRPMNSFEYIRALEILKAEFAPWINGGLTPLVEVLRDVDWSASPGEPWVSRGCATKAVAWLMFAFEIMQMVEKLLKGEFVECLFIATTKCELLPAGKEDRIFCPSPFHHQLACAILFKKFADSLTMTVGKHSSAIGMNVFGGGLQKAFFKLNQMPFGYDADHKGWDGGLRQAEPERDFLKTGLPVEYHAAVDLLFNLALCPQVRVHDSVLQMCFQPSGWYLTTVVNTLKNYRQVCEAYMDEHFAQFDQPCTIDIMRDNLLVLAGGDDLAYSTRSEWFSIVRLAGWAEKRGVYMESDFLTPRSPLRLTFFSHRLFPRYVAFCDRTVLVAGGRMNKMISAFHYQKKQNGVVDNLANAQRVVGLMMNLWAFADVYNLLYEYMYHLVHHYFLRDGQNLSPEWRGVFRSMPTDLTMMRLLSGRKPEAFFSSSKSGFCKVKIISALKSVHSTMDAIDDAMDTTSSDDSNAHWDDQDFHEMVARLGIEDHLSAPSSAPDRCQPSPTASHRNDPDSDSDSDDLPLFTLPSRKRKRTSYGNTAAYELEVNALPINSVSVDSLRQALCRHALDRIDKLVEMRNIVQVGISCGQNNLKAIDGEIESIKKSLRFF